MRHTIIVFASFTLLACATQSTDIPYIESMAHAGYCTNQYGQKLSHQACGKKAVHESENKQPTESEKMGNAINEAMKKRQQ